MAGKNTINRTMAKSQMLGHSDGLHYTVFVDALWSRLSIRLQPERLYSFRYRSRLLFNGRLHLQVRGY